MFHASWGKSGRQQGKQLALHVCANWLVFSKTWDIRTNVRLNENVLYTNTFSAFNMPPFCIPIWPALALSGCFQIHSIGQHELNTLHACGNVTMNFITFNIFNWSMGCMDIGTGGIQAVEPNHEVVNSNETEKPPEIELVTSNFRRSKNFT
ncbi:uncharacterized protein LOC106093191 isoform X1 [Stomoxys calcitrans]|uniref:uncharacterized protein LOC106093191 isoform X1 n=1 Tax=Stomoxys calcitrans TaxID=35570 RepID=UPI0027E3573F|nr:uncharacterized protein LOC106093191 isoform X1 [Stomoxys calcitrans]